MWKLFAFSLLVAALSSCASGPPADPNNICRVLADERGWKKDARKAYKRWGLPPHIGFAFIHRESTFDAKAKPARKKLLELSPWRALLQRLAMLRQLTKPGLIIKRARGDDSPSEIIWVMRLILLVGITIPVIVVLDCLRATRTACISPITVATVAMLEAHGRSPRPSRATRKRRHDRPPYTSGSFGNAESKAERACLGAGVTRLPVR